MTTSSTTDTTEPQDCPVCPPGTRHENKHFHDAFFPDAPEPQETRQEPFTKGNAGRFDCYANAEPDEPMFILLGRDQMAPELVRRWAAMRERNGESAEKVADANACADAMEVWRAKNRAPSSSPQEPQKDETCRACAGSGKDHDGRSNDPLLPCPSCRGTKREPRGPHAALIAEIERALKAPMPPLDVNGLLGRCLLALKGEPTP